MNYLLCLIFFMGGLWGSSKNSTKNEPLVTLYQNESYGVVQLMYWPKNFPAEPAYVAGSGFLIGREGYFVTAAHVLEHYDPNSKQTLVVTLRQREFGSSGMWFDVVEKDEKHDLVLCKIPSFSNMKEPHGRAANGRPADTFAPFVSLALSELHLFRDRRLLFLVSH